MALGGKARCSCLHGGVTPDPAEDRSPDRPIWKCGAFVWFALSVSTLEKPGKSKGIHFLYWLVNLTCQCFMERDLPCFSLKT